MNLYVCATYDNPLGDIQVLNHTSSYISYSSSPNIYYISKFINVFLKK